MHDHRPHPTPLPAHGCSCTDESAYLEGRRLVRVDYYAGSVFQCDEQVWLCDRCITNLQRDDHVDVTVLR